MPPSDIHGLLLWTNSKCSAINPASSRATLTQSAAQRCSPCWQQWAYNSILHCPHKCSSIRWADYQHFLFSWKVLCVLWYLGTTIFGFKVVSVSLQLVLSWILFINSSVATSAPPTPASLNPFSSHFKRKQGHIGIPASLCHHFLAVTAGSHIKGFILNLWLFISPLWL